MKLKTLAFLLYILFAGSMFSQEKILEGRIMAEEDIELEGLNIQNLSLRRGSITDVNGHFRIPAKLHDTISISAIHIQTIIVIVEEEHIRDKRISINLIEKLTELEAVNLRRNALTGFIGNDAKNIPTKDVLTAASLGLPNADMPRLTKTQRAIYTAKSSGGGIPLDPLINLITGRTKMLKNRLKSENKANLTLYLLEKFPQTYFTNSLLLEAEDVYSFVFYCEDDPQYTTVMRQSTIEIIEFLERKSLEYLLKAGE